MMDEEALQAITSQLGSSRRERGSMNGATISPLSPRLGRGERVESSWEDVESSSGSGSGSGSETYDDNGRRTRTDTASTVRADTDGAWEDESSSDEDGSGSAQSSTTELGDTKGSRTRSSKRDYRHSKRALLMSESNNMDRYRRLMNGDDATGDNGKCVEGNRSSGGGSPGDHTPVQGSTLSVPSTPAAQIAVLKQSGSPKLAPLELGRDVLALKATPVKEEYASEPASPTGETDESLHRAAAPNGIQSSPRPSLPLSKQPGASFPSTMPTDRRPKLDPSQRMVSSQLDQLVDASPPFSLWDYLKEEIMATDFDSTQELKWERVTNFISIPFWMEKIMVLGFAICLDSFLYTFTILPIRSLVALYMWLRNTVYWMAGGQKRYMHSSHKCDILKALLIVLSCYILSRTTDASKMYHFVRGQDVVKLYVIFNVLEIADRLCCSFGQDLLDSLFSRLTLARRKDGRQPYLRPIGFFVLSLGYVLAHTLVLFYQLVTLNVAINSYDDALLTLLLSNQFVEIKGSVFKKFEKENLFQLTCADIVERFQLTLMLSAIGLRNLIEVAGAAGNSAAMSKSSSTLAAASAAVNKSSILPTSLNAAAILGPLPTSFTVFPSFSLLETTFTPVLIVLASECLVDWLKHAFITKFNHIRPSVYGRYMDVLCRDLTVAGGATASRKRRTFVDQSPVVSRRLGFAAIPLACLVVRISSQIMSMLVDDSGFDECAMPDIHQGLSSDSQNAFANAYRFVHRLVVFVVGRFTHQADIKVDLVINYFVRASAWLLTIFVAWLFLVAVKLLLGTNLVSYASHRYSTIAEREREEELNARDRQPIGVDKEDKAYDAKMMQLIDKKEDDAHRLGLNGQPIQTPAYKKDVKKGPMTSLMEVDRYSMIRSRIW